MDKSNAIVCFPRMKEEKQKTKVIRFKYIKI